MGVGDVDDLVSADLGLSLGDQALDSPLSVEDVSDVLVLLFDLVELGDELLVLGAEGPDVLLVFFDVEFELVVVLAHLVEHGGDLLEFHSDLVHLGDLGSK